ncbi:MAG: nucleotidyltransferase domain-containing protein [Elusimicrobiota bacterium]|nr:nucleotidyltransferase domain-containing protein [Elusimicrobiota bacterium]
MKDSIIQDIKAILSAYSGVDSAIIYGSRAKGNFKPYSDIDISLKGNLTLNEKWKIENNIDDLLLPYKTDIVLFSNITNKDLIEHINRVGKTFYAR